MTLHGKVVFLTGSSIGIGRETALLFAKEGARVVITYYKDKKEGEAAVASCRSAGAADTLLIRLDVTDEKSIRAAVEKAVEQFGDIAILINNAGIVVWKYLAEQTFDEISNQVRTNLEGLIKMTKECLPHITDMIINLGSSAGLAGYADLSTYCATKWGVRGFTKSLAEELTRIKVYAVNPGAIATRMNDFEGMPPEKVAEVILNLAKGDYRLESGSDVNIWDYAR